MVGKRRRPGTVKVGVWLCAALGLGLGQGCAVERSPANLLIVTLDTLRADHLGVYGYEAATSPGIDAFARTATVFRDVTCSMPTTLPSHLTLFTGLLPAEHGVTANGMVPTRDLVSIFDLLGQRGFKTAAVVAAKVLDEKYLQGLGLDQVFFGDGKNPQAYDLPADGITGQATAWLRGWLRDPGEAPFALWLHYFDAHEPYDPAPGFAERFVGDYGGALGPSVSSQYLFTLNTPQQAAELSPADRQHIIDLYDAEVAFVDHHLARLFDFLKAKALWRETLIVVVGDHGQAHGEEGFWGHGERLIEPVIKVPFIVKLPRQERGHVVDAAVETRDLVPTLGAALGVATPSELGGRSLLPALRGEGVDSMTLRRTDRRTYEDRPVRRAMALHGGSWKMIFYIEEDGPRFHFGRRAGAGGLDGQNFYTADSLNLRLLDALLSQGEAAPPRKLDVDEEERQMLRALGYL